MTPTNDKVMLREERKGADERYLWAYLDDEGSLHIDGQDLGPSTGPVSPDGEYEWFTTIRAPHVAELSELLGCPPGDAILGVLESRYSGDASYELERIIRESHLPVERFSC